MTSLFGIMLMILHWAYNLCTTSKNDNISSIICYVLLKFFTSSLQKRRKKNVIINQSILSICNTNKSYLPTEQSQFIISLKIH